MTDNFSSAIKPAMTLITTAEAAARLGVHRTRVNVLIKEGRLPAQRYGRAYLIDEKDLKLVEVRPVGRPPKVEATKAQAAKEKGK